MSIAIDKTDRRLVIFNFDLPKTQSRTNRGI
jgi:hypothetical protein